MRTIPTAVAALVLICTAAHAGDEGICPTSCRPEERELLERLTAITQADVVIFTARTRTETAPRITLDIKVEGPACRWVPKAAAQLNAIGNVIAASQTATAFPHLQYNLSLTDTDSLPSNRVVRIADLVDAVKHGEPAVKLFAHGRRTASDAIVDRCLPPMLAGPEGESWKQVYGW